MIKGYGKLFWTTGYHQNDNGKDSEIINWAKKGKKEVGKLGRGGGVGEGGRKSIWIYIMQKEE